MRFGNDISLNGSLLVVGAPTDGTDGNGRVFRDGAGSAYVFDNTDWSLIEKVQAWGHDINANDQVGVTVVGDDGHLFVASTQHGYDADGRNFLEGAGAVYYFLWSGSAWQIVQKITPSTRAEGQQFGKSIAFTETKCLIGSPGNNSAYLFSKTAGKWVEEMTLTAPDQESGDEFGYRVALSTYIAVSSLSATDSQSGNPLSRAGAVYLYTETGDLMEKITATGPNARQANDEFGMSLAIDGIWLIIGSEHHGFDNDGLDERPNAGAVWIYRYDAGSWALVQKIANSTQYRNLNAEFGYSIGYDGEVLAIGSPQDWYSATNGNKVENAGAVFIWRNTAGTFTYEAKLVAQAAIGWEDDSPAREANGRFGHAVDVVNGRVVVGGLSALDDQSANPLQAAGKVWVFHRPTSAWTCSQIITAPIRAAGMKFGFSLSATNGDLFITAPGDITDEVSANPLTADVGAVYVYSDGGLGEYQLVTKFVATNRADGEQFGYSVSARGSIAVIGCPYRDYQMPGAGMAFIYRKNAGSWVFDDAVGPIGEERNSGDDFSNSFAIDGNILVVGARNHDYDRHNRNFISNAGAVFVYEWVNGWEFRKKITPTGLNARNADDNFGAAVGISGNLIAVGSPGHAYDEIGDNPVSGAGAVYIYDRSTGQQVQKIIAGGTNARQPNDAFGNIIDLNGDSLIVGTPNHPWDTAGGNYVEQAGAAWVFYRINGLFVQQSRLVAGDRAAGDRFGTSVSIEGNRAVVGSPFNATNMIGENPLPAAGASYVFERIGIPEVTITGNDITSTATVTTRQTITLTDGQVYTVPENRQISAILIGEGSPTSSGSLVHSHLNLPANTQLTASITANGTRLLKDGNDKVNLTFETDTFDTVSPYRNINVTTTTDAITGTRSGVFANSAIVYTTGTPVGTGDWEFSAKVKITNTSVQNTFMVLGTNSNGLALRYVPGNGLLVEMNAPSFSRYWAFSPVAGTVYSVNVKRVSGSVSVTINGTPVGSPVSGTVDISTTGDLKIGAFSIDPIVGGFQGIMDDISFRYAANSFMSARSATGGSDSLPPDGGTIRPAIGPMLDAMDYPDVLIGNGNSHINAGQIILSWEETETITHTGSGTPAVITAILDPINDVVTGFEIVDGGSGYVTEPALSIPGGVRARAVLGATPISAIDVTVAGDGYTAAPTVTITNGNPDATAVAYLQPTSVAAITVINGGSGYTVPPTLTIDGVQAIAHLSGDSISHVTVTDAGSGLNGHETITITGDGSGAILEIEYQPVGIASIAVLTSGSYEIPPTVTLTPNKGTETEVTFGGTSITGVTLLSGGSGFTEFREIAKLTEWGHDRNAGDHFGSAVASDGPTVVIAASDHQFDSSGFQPILSSGAVYVFESQPGFGAVQMRGDVTVNFNSTIDDLVGDFAVGLRYRPADLSTEQLILNVSGIELSIANHTFTLSANGKSVDLYGIGQYYETVNRWFNLAISYTDGKVLGFVDGELLGIISWPGLVIDSNERYDATRLLRGDLAKVIFATGVYDHSNITTLFDLPAAETVGYYVPENASGQQWLDSSPAANTATIIGTTAGQVFSVVPNTGWGFAEKLTPVGRTAGDKFGHAVSVAGDMIAASSPYHGYDVDGANLLENAGAVWVWYKNGHWREQVKLTATGTNARQVNDAFGHAIALSDIWLFISAPNHGWNADGSGPEIPGAGAVWVYRRYGNTWNFHQKIVPTGINARQANDAFGHALALSGDRVAISAPRHAYLANGTGAVTNAGAVFTYTLTNDEWVFEQKITAFGANGRMPNDQFGSSLALRGNVLVVGASNQDYDGAGANPITNAGACYTFTRPATTWQAGTKIISTAREENQYFGKQVAVWDIIVVRGTETRQAFTLAGAPIALPTRETSRTLASGWGLYIEPAALGETELRNAITDAVVSTSINTVNDYGFIGQTSISPTTTVTIPSNANMTVDGDFTIELHFLPIRKTYSGSEPITDQVLFANRASLTDLSSIEASLSVNGMVADLKVIISADGTTQAETITIPDIPYRVWSCLKIVRTGSTVMVSANGTTITKTIPTILPAGDWTLFGLADNSKIFTGRIGMMRVMSVPTDISFTKNRYPVGPVYYGDGGLAFANATTLLVGNPLAGNTGIAEIESVDQAGTVSVYTFGTSWVENGELTAGGKTGLPLSSGRMADARFGHAVAIRDGRIFVTAPQSSTSTLNGYSVRNSGKVQVWDKSLNFLSTIISPDRRVVDQRFGHALAVKGDILVSSVSYSDTMVAVSETSGKTIRYLHGSRAVFVLRDDQTRPTPARQGRLTGVGKSLISQPFRVIDMMLTYREGGSVTQPTWQYPSPAPANATGNVLSYHLGKILTDNISHYGHSENYNDIASGGVQYKTSTGGMGYHIPDGTDRTRTANSHYGQSVATNGTKVVIGSPLASWNQYGTVETPAAGQVHILSYSDSVWLPERVISGDTEGQHLGRLVAIGQEISAATETSIIRYSVDYQPTSIAGQAASLIAVDDEVVIGEPTNTARGTVTVNGIIIRHDDSVPVGSRQEGAKFGHAIAVNGSDMIVLSAASSRDHFGENSGYGLIDVFTRNGTTYSEVTAFVVLPEQTTPPAYEINDISYAGTNIVAACSQYSTGIIRSFSPTGTILSSHIGSGNGFGEALMASSTRLVVGQPNYSIASVAASCGALQTFTITGGVIAGNQVMVLPGNTEGRLTTPTAGYLANGRNVGMNFGYSVSHHGDVLAVGTPLHGANDLGEMITPYAGGAMMYEWTGTRYQFGRKITPATSGYVMYGKSLSVSDGRLILLPDSNQSLNRAAKIYNSTGTMTSRVWTETGSLTIPSGPSTGISVALTATDAAIGNSRYSDGVSNIGEVQTARRSGETWSVGASIRPTGMTGSRHAGARFGWDVAFDGTTVIIGSPNHSRLDSGAVSATNRGAVFAYTNDTEQYVLSYRILNPNNIADEYFGYTVSLSGNHTAISRNKATGTVAIYNGQTLATTLTGQNGDQFGLATTIANDRLTIGAAGFAGTTVVRPQSGGAMTVRWTGTWDTVPGVQGNYLVAGTKDSFGEIVNLGYSKQRTAGMNFGKSIARFNDIYIVSANGDNATTSGETTTVSGSIFTIEKTSEYRIRQHLLAEKAGAFGAGVATTAAGIFVTDPVNNEVTRLTETSGRLSISDRVIVGEEPAALTAWGEYAVIGDTSHAGSPAKENAGVVHTMSMSATYGSRPSAASPISVVTLSGNSSHDSLGGGGGSYGSMSANRGGAAILLSTVTEYPGSGITPGLAGHPSRNTAGEPGQNGAIILTANGVATEFRQSGSRQTYVVPPTVTELSVTMWGAGGGNHPAGMTGKAGAAVQGTIPVKSGMILTIEVGGAGKNGQPSTGGPSPFIAGGWPNGGAGSQNYASAQSGSGGGASSIIGDTDTVLLSAGGGAGGGLANTSTAGGDLPAIPTVIHQSAYTMAPDTGLSRLPDSYFGTAVVFSDNRLYVGMPGGNYAADQSTYGQRGNVVEISGTAITGILSPNDINAYTDFGSLLSWKDGMLMIGGTETRKADLRTSTTYQTTVDIQPNSTLANATTIIGGDPLSRGSGTSGQLDESGTHSLVERMGLVWVQTSAIIPGKAYGRFANDRFGSSVALTANHAFIASPYHVYNDSGSSNTESGAVSIFPLINTNTSVKINGTVQFGIGGMTVTDTRVIVRGSSESVVLTHAGAALQTIPGLYVSDTVYLVPDPTASRGDDGQPDVTNAGNLIEWTNGMESRVLTIPGASNARNANDQFGASVACQDGWFAVGSPGHSYSATGFSRAAGTGAVSIYRLQGTETAFEAKLVSSTNTTQDIGQYMMAASGRLVSGSASSGRGTVWRRAAVGTWVLENTHTVPNTTGVLLDETMMVIGSRSDGSVAGKPAVANSGVIYTSEYTTDWSAMDAFAVTGPVNTREEGDQFGYAVARSGTYLIVSAPYHNRDIDGGNELSNSGIVTVYRRLNNGEIVMIQRIASPSRMAEGKFGHAIAMSDRGNRFAVSELGSGKVYLYAINAEITLEETFTGLAADGFGESIALNARNLVIGAPLHDWDVNGENEMANAGAVYWYRNVGGSWSLVEKITSINRQAGNQFGHRVSLSENNALAVGSSSASGNPALMNSGQMETHYLS